MLTLSGTWYYMRKKGDSIDYRKEKVSYIWDSFFLFLQRAHPLSPNRETLNRLDYERLSGKEIGGRQIYFWEMQNRSILRPSWV